jgi:hypothetical protein
MSSLLRRWFPRPPRPQLREQLRLELADGHSLPLLRVRDPRARRIKLSVNEQGARLSLPRTASLREAEAFLQAHRDWLERQWQRIGTHPARGFDRDTRTVPLRSEALPVNWEEGRGVRAEFAGGELRLVRTARATPAQLRRALKDAYLAEARADLARWLPRYLPGLPAAPTRIALRPMTSLWGSLSARDALALDLSLLLGRPAAFEYVLVHELCHLLHRDHSRRFWREVEARCPDWREQRDYLRDTGPQLKRRLRELLAAG